MNEVLIKEAVEKETDSDTFPGVLLGLVDPRRPFESKEMAITQDLRGHKRKLLYVRLMR
jgi:hypothetical protein